MVIGLHERISGHASRVRVLDRIFSRLPKHQVDSDNGVGRGAQHLPDQAGGHRRVLHERAGAQLRWPRGYPLFCPLAYIPFHLL